MKAIVCVVLLLLLTACISLPTQDVPVNSPLAFETDDFREQEIYPNPEDAETEPEPFDDDTSDNFPDIPTPAQDVLLFEANLKKYGIIQVTVDMVYDGEWLEASLSIMDEMGCFGLELYGFPEFIPADLDGDGADEIIVMDGLAEPTICAIVGFDGEEFYQFTLSENDLVLTCDYTVTGRVALLLENLNTEMTITLDDKDLRAMDNRGEVKFVKGGIRLQSGRFMDRQYVNPYYSYCYDRISHDLGIQVTYWTELYEITAVFGIVLEEDRLITVLESMEWDFKNQYFLYEYEHTMETPEISAYGYSRSMAASSLISLDMGCQEYHELHNGYYYDRISYTHTDGHTGCYARYGDSPNALYLNFTYTDEVNDVSVLDYMALRLPYLKTSAGLSLEDPVRKMVELYGGSDENGMHKYRSEDGVYGMDILVLRGFVATIDIFRMDSSFLANEKSTVGKVGKFHIGMDLFEFGVVNDAFAHYNLIHHGGGSANCFERYSVDGLMLYFGGNGHENYRLDYIKIYIPRYYVEVDGNGYMLYDEIPENAETVFEKDGIRTELIVSDGIICEIILSNMNPLFTLQGK